jgi:hypothetical protein
LINGDLRSKSLAVLPQGATSVDKYRLTPQEVWELGGTGKSLKKSL